MGLNIAIFNTKIILIVFEEQVPTAINLFCHILLITGQFFIFFIIIESILFRYWTKFVWKSVQSINDKFVINFLTMFNSFMSLLFSLYEHIPKTGNENVFAYDLTGRIPGEFKAQLSNNFRYDIY